MGILHCGCSVSFFTPALYKYISGCNVTEINIANEEVVNEDIQALVEKVHCMVIYSQLVYEKLHSQTVVAQC